MKRLRLLVLVLLLVLSAGGVFYFWKHYQKRPAPKRKASALVQPTPMPLETLPSPTPSPRVQPSPLPARSPLPESLPSAPLASPAAQPESLPRAESQPTESQPLIQISMGNPIRIAEGSTLDLDQVQVQYAGKAKLNYQWKLAGGPAEFFRIQNPDQANPRVTLKNTDQPLEFSLHLNVTDRQTEASGDLKISVFPARLQLKGMAGGAFVGIQHMGDKWVAARGDTLEVFDADMMPLARADAGHPITQFFGIMGSEGKGMLFVQAPEGPWSLMQADPVQGVSKAQLPMLGRNIRRVVPFQMDGTPYMFALLERSIDLWNLSDPKHPRLKTSLGTFLKDPLYLVFTQRNLYVAEEGSIHLIDFATGNLVASVPSGGSITSLTTFAVDGKNYLLASIGKDRTKQNRTDYGLRVFEIAENGRLEAERRLKLGENLAVEKLKIVPGPNLALATVSSPQGWALKLVELSQFKEVPLNSTDPIHFVALSEIETGKIKDRRVGVVADGNQLRVLEFKPQGSPPTQASFSQISAIPSILSASWIQATENGSRVGVGDAGTMQGGALALMDSATWQVKETRNALANMFPGDADFTLPTAPYPAFYLAEDIKSQDPKTPAGRLAFLSFDDKGGSDVAFSAGFLGAVGPQGILRPAGLAARNLEDRLRLVVAVAKLNGSMSGSGLVLLDKMKEMTPQAFLQGDLAKSQTLVPLPDARDVALSVNGKIAFVAAGVSGLIAVDLEQKTPVSRMSLGTNDWLADGVLLSHQGSMVLASFINPSTRKVLIKIFGIVNGNQMQEYGTIADLPGLSALAGSRSPRFALTADDLYLFVPTQERVLSVFNLSNPADPIPIVQTELEGEIRAISVANRFKDIFVALGQAGVAKLEFGF